VADLNGDVVALFDPWDSHGFPRHDLSDRAHIHPDRDAARLRSYPRRGRHLVWNPCVDGSRGRPDNATGRPQPVCHQRNVEERRHRANLQRHIAIRRLRHCAYYWTYGISSNIALARQTDELTTIRNRARLCVFQVS
jgi:hypothetical protein